MAAEEVAQEEVPAPVVPNSDGKLLPDMSEVDIADAATDAPAAEGGGVASEEGGEPNATLDEFLAAEDDKGVESLPPTFAMQVVEKLKPLAEYQVAQKGMEVYDKVSEVFGGPSVEGLAKDLEEVLHVHQVEGMVAATKVTTAKGLDYTKKATVHTYTNTKEYAADKANVAKGAVVGAKDKAVGAAFASLEAAKPHVQRVLENPNVERVVGAATEASVGVGSMVTTVTTTAKAKADALRGNTPEAAALAEAEAEAWGQVLAGDGIGGSRAKGEEMEIPARTTHTSTFFVKRGAVLCWRFRVASHDVGFALRLRVQGDGGSSEVDVFGMQRYPCGVTVQGEWSPPSDAALVAVWDNAYSYLREKRVAFSARVKKPEEEEEAAEAAAAAATAAAAAAATAAPAPAAPAAKDASAADLAPASPGTEPVEPAVEVPAPAAEEPAAEVGAAVGAVPEAEASSSHPVAEAGAGGEPGAVVEAAKETDEPASFDAAPANVAEAGEEGDEAAFSEPAATSSKSKKKGKGKKK